MNIISIIRYFGPLLLIALGGYLFRVRNKRGDWILLGCILWYVMFFFYFFGPGEDLRYLLATVPFLAILGGRFLATVNKKWLRKFFLCLCIIQFLGAGIYVGIKRRTPKDLKEVFAFIKHNTPPESLILYPGHIFLEKTDRKVLWTRFPGFLQILFWAEPSVRRAAIKSTDLDYIVVDKQRIYDDSHVRHPNGFPQSFVDKTKHFDFLELVFENERAVIFEVDENRL